LRTASDAASSNCRRNGRYSLRILVEDELDRLESQYTERERATEREEELSLIRPYVKQWQAEGGIREGDPDAIAGAVHAVVLLTLHREDIGENYEAVRNTLIEIVADGLVAN
jgi:hypothetical protein